MHRTHLDKMMVIGQRKPDDREIVAHDHRVIVAHDHHVIVAIDWPFTRSNDPHFSQEFLLLIFDRIVKKLSNFEGRS